MRFAVPLVALLAVASSTFASLIARQSLPNCAVQCLANANTQPCSATDDACLCKNQAFVNSTTTCILSSCSGSDLQNAEAFAEQLCIAVGVTLTMSSAKATSTSTSTSTSSASPSPSNGAVMNRGISEFAGAVAGLAIAVVL